MNKELFCFELKKVGMTVPELAKYLGISKVTLYRKISGESDFYRDEIQKCRELFGIDVADSIFFVNDNRRIKMNKGQCERAIAALLSALERLEKEAATPAHYEAMAKVAGVLVELSRCRVTATTFEHGNVN